MEAIKATAEGAANVAIKIVRGHGTAAATADLNHRFVIDMASLKR
jgi:hypothetical protein